MGNDDNFLASLEIRQIDSDIDLDNFDCDEGEGTEPGSINWYLRNAALEHHKKRVSTVTCWLNNGNLTGFMTTTMSYAEIKESSWRDKLGLGSVKIKEQGKHIKRFPAMLIGMLGVDKRYRGKGLGKLMVGEAIASAFEIAPKVACRIVQVDSLWTDDAMGLYTAMGFTLAEGKEDRGTAWMYFDLKERLDGR